MIGNIKRPNPLKPFDPSSYFDPTTNTCTEADFIKILEKGVYDSSLIGKFVTLSNTVDYNGGKWVIADVDHDSENTGQTNCYDLISEDSFYYSQIGSNFWYGSSLETTLNSTFYNGFSSNFKAHMLNIKYSSNGDWFTNDKIIIPSVNELNYNSYALSYQEGVAYPIFTDNTSRIKKYYNAGNSDWWTRTGSNNGVWAVTSTGYIESGHGYATYCGTAPILRVQ